MSKEIYYRIYNKLVSDVYPTDFFKKTRDWMRRVPTALLVLILIIAGMVGLLIVTHNYKTAHLTDEERILLKELVNKSNITFLTGEKKSLILEKLSYPAKKSQNEILILGAFLFLLGIFLFLGKGRTETEYIGWEEAVAITYVHLERIRTTIYEKDPSYAFKIEAIARARYWGSTVLGQEPIPFYWFIKVQIKEQDKWKTRLVILDPRRKPKIKNWIVSIQEIPEGFKGKEWKNIDFVPVGEILTVSETEKSIE